MKIIEGRGEREGRGEGGKGRGEGGRKGREGRRGGGNTG